MVTFEDVFGTVLPPDTLTALQQATSNRRDLVESLTYAGSRADPRGVLSASELYIPVLLQLLRSLEASSTTEISVKKKFCFSWSSVLSAKPGYRVIFKIDVFSDGALLRKPFTSHVLVFEVVEVLFVRALSHANLAGILVDSQGSVFNQL